MNNIGTEKVFRELQKYIDAHTDELTDDSSLKAITQQFMTEYNENIRLNTHNKAAPKTADDYLELSTDAATRADALKYAKAASKLEPDNLDAAVAVAHLTAKDSIALLDALAVLIPKGTKQMEEGHYFKEYMGDFWLAHQTRPYMRLRYEYMQTLKECGMYRRAIEEGKQLLQLCTNDNLGVRYDLMHMYAMMEDEVSALALRDSFEYSDSECQMLLSLAVLYFKLGKLDESLLYIKKLQKANKDTKKFFSLVASGDLDELYDMVNEYSYRPCTIEELAVAFIGNQYLFLTMVPFFEWVYKKIRNSKSKT